MEEMADLSGFGLNLKVISSGSYNVLPFISVHVTQKFTAEYLTFFTQQLAYCLMVSTEES